MPKKSRRAKPKQPLPLERAEDVSNEDTDPPMHKSAYFALPLRKRVPSEKCDCRMHVELRKVSFSPGAAIMVAIFPTSRFLVENIPMDFHLSEDGMLTEYFNSWHEHAVPSAA